MIFSTSENDNKRFTNFYKNEKGFSLIEVIIAMVIFLIVTTAIYGLLQVARVDRNRSSRRADILKNARVAVHLIGRDALNAGLGYHRVGAIVPDNFLSSKLGIPADTDTNRDILTSIVAGNNIYTNNLQTDPNVKTDMITFAFRDLDFNNSSVVELQNVNTPAADLQTARLVTKDASGAIEVKPNDLYLIESDTSQVAVMASGIPAPNQIDVSPTDALGINQPIDGLNADGSLLRKCVDSADLNCTTYLASLKRFFLVKYHVNNEGTLIRSVFGNNRTGTIPADQRQEFPLAYNVENLQIRYVLKNGTVTENPSAGDDGIAGTADDTIEDFNLIRQITVTLTVQSVEADEQTQKLDKITITSTFSARNMEYDAG
ncbi:MAG: prepilin-type N-terminal cleavage/methylation domain-containing protein [Pyrinomonadaceae bacterium]